MANRLSFRPAALQSALNNGGRVGRHATADARIRRAAKDGLLRHRVARIAIPALLLVSILAGLIGGPTLMIVPSVLVFLAWGALILPLETIVPAIVFLLCSVNQPFGNPGNRQVDWFLNPIGKLLYSNISILTLADVIVGVLVFRSAAILLLSEREEGLDRRPPRPFAQACLIAFLTIVGLELMGILFNDGNFRQSFWQMRVPLVLPAFSLAVSAAATDIGIRRIRAALLAAGVVKAIEAVVVVFVYKVDGNFAGGYVTTHSDSVIWVTCVAILLATWFETRRRFDFELMLVLCPLYMLAIQLNNRRVAWVSLIASVWFIVAVAHPPVKRQLGRYLGYCWPLIVVYLVIGFGAQPANVLFSPVVKIASVSTKADASTSTRDIENTNLLITIRAYPLLGSGFGHEYNEVVKAYDLKKDFPQYRFMPHNSFLGFWAFNSLVGSTLYFLLPVVALYYAVGSRRQSQIPARRAAGAWSACVVIVYLVQAWADLGMQDWVAMACVSVAYGISGSLGRATIAENAPKRAAKKLDYVDDDDIAAPQHLQQVSSAGR